MDQDVAREVEEDTGPQPQEELPVSQSQSEHSGSEMEDWEEEEDGEDMDGSWEYEREPDPIIFHLVQKEDLAAVSQMLKSDRTAVHQRDSMGHTPIHEPSSGFSDESLAVDMAKLLLSYGAPVNSQTSHLYTPLHIACVTGKGKICDLLLMNGARYDLKLDEERAQTPLDCARESLNRKMEILNMFRR